MRNETWKRLGHFFEYGDLVPFAVMTSVWHFVLAVKSHGEGWVTATAQGIFVDMLHFRTVRAAVRQRTATSVLLALVTTAISYAFHVLFYIHGTADGHFQWIHLLLAAPLPLGIPVLAWQQETAQEPFLYARIRRIVRYAMRYRGILKLARTALKQTETKLSETETALKQTETKLSETETALKQTDGRAKQAETRLESLEGELKQLKDRVAIFEAMKRKMNPLAFDVALYAAGVSNMTGQQIAEKHEVSTGTVSAFKAKMNGGGDESGN